MPWSPDFVPRLRSWLSQTAARPVSWWASVHRATRGRDTTLIAVTGSFGKTTTTRAIATILGQPVDQENRFNAFSRMYLQAIHQTRSQPVGVLEVGIGRPNQMRRYARVIRPDIAVVTHIGMEHERYFPDGLDGIAAEKGELVRALPASGTAVLNRDDDRVMAMASYTRARVVTFGRHPDADVLLVASVATVRGMHLTICIDGKDHALQTALLGSVMAVPILAAIAAAYAAGLDIEQAVSSLQHLTPTPRRLQPVPLPNGVVALLDDIKGTPATAHAAFDAIAELPPGRRVAVLGNIPLSTPEPKAPVYRELGLHAGRTFDRVFLIHLVDDQFEAYRQALIDGGLAADRITRVKDVQETAAMLQQELQPGDTLLLKGHFIDHLSRVVMLLREEPCHCRLSLCLIRGADWCDRCPHVLRQSA